MRLAVSIEVHREVMATVFSVAIVHHDADYAAQAAGEALDEVQRVELHLSRFVPTSDVSRLNRAAAGTSVLVHPDVFDCLAIAEGIRRETAGAFDVGFRSGCMPEDGSRFHLADVRPEVQILQDGLSLDLDGIGKGYALDRMAALLDDWDLTAFRLRASSSTQLFGDPPPGRNGWPVTLETEPKATRLRLQRQGVSASGRAVRGQHIIDPRSDQPAARGRAWAVAPTAAQADALSTAFMVMCDGQIRNLCRRRKEIAGYVATSGADY